MPGNVYNPSPFGGIQSPYMQNPYQRYEPYGGSPLAMYADLAMNIFGIQPGQPGQLDIGMNRNVNLYGNLRYQHRTRQHSQAMLRSYEDDTGLFLDQVRGIYVAGGKGDQYTAKTHQTFLDVHNAAASSMPFLDSPEALRTYDMAHGGRSRMPMAHYIAATGQGYQPSMYSDPAKSGQRAADLASSIHQQFFAGGDPTNFSRSGGLSAVQMGETFQALASTGRMPELGRSNDPRMQKWSQKDAGRQANEVLGRYAEILGTLNEIFVAEGRVDTPMGELLQAADTLTGGLQQMTSKQAVARVRSIYETAGRMGLGSEAIVANLEGTSMMAQQYGLNQAFALPMAQYGFEFKQATRGLQSVEGSWGLKSADELMMMAQGKQAAFLGSEAGNRMGMLWRLMERKYGKTANGGIDASKITGDDPTAVAMRALATGQVNNAELAQLGRSNEREFMGRIGGALGMDASTLAMERSFTSANQEASFVNDLARFGAPMQGREWQEKILDPSMARPTNLALRGILGRGRDTNRFARDMARVSSEAFMTLRPEDAADPLVRRARLAEAQKKWLQAQAQAGNVQAQQTLAGLSVQEGGLDVGLRNLADQQYNAANQENQRRTGTTTDLQNFQAMYNRGVSADTIRQNADTQVNVKAAAMGLGAVTQGGIFERLAQSIAKAGITGKGDAATIVREALGQDVTGSQAKRIAEVIKSVQADEVKLQALNKKLHDEGLGKDDETLNQRNALEIASKKKLDDLKAELAKSTNPAIVKALEDAKKNDEANAKGREEDKLSPGGRGSLNIDTLTLVVGADAIIDKAKVQEVKQNNKGQGATPK